MGKMKKWFPLLLGAAFVLCVGVTGVCAQNRAKDETIYEGVYVNSISLGGMTEQEVEDMLSTYVEELLAQPIKITLGNRYLEIMPEDINLQWMNPSIAKEAYNVGRCGNLIKRFKEQQDLETASVEFRTVFAADETLLRTLLTEKQEMLSTPAINWDLEKNGNTFTAIPGETGILMLLEESYDLLENYFANEYAPGTTTPELVSSVAQPLGSEEELALVRDVLGSFSTWYTGGSTGRDQNVENGISKINGTLLYPGEGFSVHEAVSPFTAENGYGVGYAYENGIVIESYGGGICQVSTTLYNAVIRAELEVTQRAPHSMVVGYVEPAEDAAIAGDYKDLKFVNNLEHPIYIEGYTTSDKQAFFKIYGVETRSDDREISFEHEIVEEEIPDPKFTEVNKPIGHVVCKQGIHTGYKAYLWKIVKENGVEVERVKVNTSKYTASAALYDVGMKSDHPEAIAAMKEAIALAIEYNKPEFVYDTAKYWTDAAIEAREEADEPHEGPVIEDYLKEPEEETETETGDEEE